MQGQNAGSAMPISNSSGHDGLKKTLSWTVVDEDDGLSLKPQPSPSQDETSAQECMDIKFMMFRIPHKHPHRLKRPLHHSDDLSGFHFAVRPYSIVSLTEQEVIVERCLQDDILCLDLFAKSSVNADKMIKHLKQWSIEDGMRFAQGQTTQQKHSLLPHNRFKCVLLLCLYDKSRLHNIYNILLIVGDSLFNKTHQLY